MRVQTKSVLICLVCIAIVFGAASLILYPKLAGPFSGIGNAIHETRMDLLGAEKFQYPPHRVKQLADPDIPWEYQLYRACDDCPIPMYIVTDEQGWYRGLNTQIRIMNIKPKYRYGMELPAGDYNIEIQWDPSRRNTIYKRTVSLTPDNNVFMFIANGGKGDARARY